MSDAPLRLSIFGGMDAWPLYVMREKGFLDVTLTPTPGSVAQIQRMMAGEADMASTAMDNILAYNEDQGDPSVSGPFDFVAIAGIGPGSLNLVVRPEITSYEQLRGKTFAVDAAGTGFSFVLRRMLEMNGVLPGEYSFAAVGSTQRRFDAMVDGQAAGGLVGRPYDIIGAEQHGFKVLGNARDALVHYQATVVMVRRSWAKTNHQAIAAFIRAYRLAAAWLFEPANAVDAGSILARNTDLAADLINRVAPGVLTDRASYSSGGEFDRAGVETVLELRTAYAVPKKRLGSAAHYIDQSYL